MSDKQPVEKDDDVTFDIYHLFSRKDVIAVVLLILALLGYVVYKSVFISSVI